MTDTICHEVKVVHEWTKEEKHTLRQIMEHSLRTWPAVARTYSQCQATITIRAKERGWGDWQSVADFDLDLIRRFNEGQKDEVIDRMADRVKSAMDEFYPDCTLCDYLEFVKEYSERRSPQSRSALHPVPTH